MDIEKEQEKITNFVKSEINKLRKKDINIAKSSLSYFALFGETIGLAKILVFRQGFLKIINYYKTIFKDLILIAKSHNLEIVNSNIPKNAKNIVISNASFNDFQENGSYVDRYFKINSDEFRKTIFIINYSENKIPKKINDNIILFRNKKINIFSGLIYLIGKIIKETLNTKFFYELSSYSVLAENLFYFIKKNFIIENIEKIIVPYEGQPFQQFLFYKIKKINNKIINIGYDHSAPHSLPLNLFYREGAPDVLLVNSISQKENSINLLNWPKEKIKLVPSLRYSLKSEESFSNKIFFPYKIFDQDLILNHLEIFLKKQKDFSLNQMEIKMHPVSPYNKEQIKLKEKIESLLLKYTRKFTEKYINQDTSLFIGATTAIIVALEKNIKVIHLCNDPVIDSYSNYMWPRLKIKKITDYLFEYLLNEKETFLIFGKEPELFKNYYLN